MDSTERFYVEWTEPDGELRELYMPCTGAQVYLVYQLYCRRLGIGKPAQHQTLSTVLAKKPGLRVSREWIRNSGGVRRQQACVLVKGLHDPPDHFDGSRIDWLSGCVEEFSKKLEQLQADGVLPVSQQQAGRPAKKSDLPSEEEVAAYGAQ